MERLTPNRKEDLCNIIACNNIANIFYCYVRKHTESPIHSSYQLIFQIKYDQENKCNIYICCQHRGHEISNNWDIIKLNKWKKKKSGGRVGGR